jgi:hypothetical protein
VSPGLWWGMYSDDDSSHIPNTSRLPDIAFSCVVWHWRCGGAVGRSCVGCGQDSVWKIGVDDAIDGGLVDVGTLAADGLLYIPPP